MRRKKRIEGMEMEKKGRERKKNIMKKLRKGEK